MGQNSKPTALFALLLFVAGADLRAGGKAYTDVEFSRPAGYSLKLDAQIPDGAGPFPAVILVHGGAWVSGDKKRSVAPLFEPLEDAGFAWFSISYRMPKISEPGRTATIAASAALLGGAIDDVRAAVLYVRKHAAEYHIDPDRIALVGESAGAQLAAVAALKPGPNEQVQAVIGFYCPSDLVSMIQTMPMIPESIRNAVKNTSFEAYLAGYLRELSPMTWVHEDAPPFLMIHGTADTVVPYEQSVAFCAALHKAGSSCDLYPVNGGGHGLRWWEPAPRLTTYKRYMVRWLKQELASDTKESGR